MSWILGVVGKPIDVALKKRLVNISGKADIKTSSSLLYITSGGTPGTHFYAENSANPQSGWLVSGVGIHYAKSQFQFMYRKEWASILSEPLSGVLNQLDGHFIIIQWFKDKVYFATDQLGLRHLYFTNIGNNQFAFSSRLDWLAKLNSQIRINFIEFGGQWLLQNKLSSNSIATNTMVISQGGFGNYSNGKLSLSNTPWHPFNKKNFSEDHISTLHKLTTFPLKNSQNLSLALSGGLDSRVLLSILLSENSINWSLHSLHNRSNPDVKIPIAISSTFKITHQIIEDEILDYRTTIEELYKFIGYTLALSPASSVLSFQFYKILMQQNKIAIDGGLGEIARRRYLNRLLISGKSALLKGNFEEIIPYLRLDRPNLFSNEILELMQNGVKEQAESFFNTMPSINKFGVENWLDLMAIRARFPNLAGFEQSRADAEIVTYMPFAQPSFLNKLLDAPLSERKNGTFLKRIIKQNYSLTKFPLIKDGVRYPFYFPTIASSLYIRLRKKMGNLYANNLPGIFLSHLSEFVLDTFSSTSVKQCIYYNYSYLQNTINAYYNGDKKYGQIVNWWLSFEILRQLLEENSDM